MSDESSVYVISEMAVIGAVWRSDNNKANSAGRSDHSEGQSQLQIVSYDVASSYDVQGLDVLSS